MRRSSLLGHCSEALHLFLSRRRPADVLMAEFFRDRRYLGAKDRRYIAETVYGVLRNYRWLTAIVASIRQSLPLPEKTAEELLLLPLFLLASSGEESASICTEIEPLWRMYVRASSCAEFLVSAKQSMASLAEPSSPVDRFSLRHTMPAAVVEEWISQLGENEAEQLCVASNRPAPTTIRVNTLLTTVEKCRTALGEEGIEASLTANSPVGLTLSRRIGTVGSRAFRMGLFEMQDEGSQILSYLVNPREGGTIVDACAGGGGKSLHLAAMMKNRGRITAMDIDTGRLDHLQERARRAGVTNIVTVQSPGRETAASAFQADAVLVDAPCSGTGTFRRNPGAALLFSMDRVVQLLRTQDEILNRASLMVRPGGRLIYATCSLLSTENESRIRQFLASHSGFRLVPAVEVLAEHGIHIPSADEFLRLFPQRHNTDGFFGAVLER